MKIAIASMGTNLNSDISPLLGRSDDFIIMDLKNGEIKDINIIENTAKNETGAGSTAAQILVDHEVDILITGKLGPVAFHILKNAGIKVYKIIPGSVQKNLKRFTEGKLKEITSLSSGFPT